MHTLLALPSSECKVNEVNDSWQCMCACATTEKALCVRHRLVKGVLFVATRVCPLLLPARCYSGSRDQVDIDQKREYISVNGKAALSSFGG